MFNWFIKTISSERFMNCYSKNPIVQKRAIINGLVDKVMNLSDEKFREKSFNKMRSMLYNNDHPIEFLERNIKIMGVII